ncbi:hypothetical protein SynA1840_02116 [Synechococcus sp. A18-40]|nr:hypothetical protein SynA1840_02116 [Synechococcus sp. A18-40]
MMTSTDMDPQTAVVMELIRGLLDLSRLADKTRSDPVRCSNSH